MLWKSGFWKTFETRFLQIASYENLCESLEINDFFIKTSFYKFLKSIIIKKGQKNFVHELPTFFLVFH